MMSNKIKINIQIPENELSFKASRSAGPGGQNVNKLSTKITLLFKVAESSYLTDWQKSRVAKKLINRISSDGTLIVTSQRHRSQLANRIDATEKLNQMLADAMKTKPPRIKTRPSRSSIEKRLKQKKQRSETKKFRSGKIGND